MRQLVKKARAALRFNRVTGSVVLMEMTERLTTFLAHRFGRVRPLTLPMSIVIRTTERCILKCRMCGQNGEHGRLAGVKAGDRQRVDPAVYDNLCEDLARWRIKPFVKFTGGEPLLEWGVLKPVIEKMVRAGCSIKFNTNGVLLKNADFAAEVVKAGTHFLSISVHGDEATHTDICRVPTAFRDIGRGIRQVREARDRLGRSYPMILLSCVVSTWNEDACHALSRVARDWGADWLNIQFLNYLTPARSAAAHDLARDRFDITEQPWRGFEIPELTRIDPEKLADTIAALKRESPCPVSTLKIGGMTADRIRAYYATDEILRRRVCHMPYVTAFVVPPGRSVFCIDYPWYFYGDLREENLSDAWFGDRAGAWRRALVDYYRRHGRNFPQCLRCNWPYNT